MRKNKLNKLHSEYVDKQNEMIASIIELKKSRERMINQLLCEYPDESNRNDFITDIKKYKFSPQKTERLQEIFDHFDPEKITHNDISDIIEAQEYIAEQKKESWLSKISNIIPDTED